MEISVPSIFDNVIKDWCLIVLTKSPSETYTYPVAAGYYESINILILKLNIMLSSRVTESR